MRRGSWACTSGHGGVTVGDFLLLCRANENKTRNLGFPSLSILTRVVLWAPGASPSPPPLPLRLPTARQNPATMIENDSDTDSDLLDSICRAVSAVRSTRSILKPQAVCLHDKFNFRALTSS